MALVKSSAVAESGTQEKTKARRMIWTIFRMYMFFGTTRSRLRSYADLTVLRAIAHVFFQFD
jgi:hypothetical protein